jgi:multiple sugar transport system substrate-binding protein
MSKKRGVRLIAVAGALTVGIAALAGCSSSSTSTGTSSGAGSSSVAGSNGANNAATGPKVKLSYAIWDQNQAPAMKQIAAAFTAQNPNITIDVQLTPNQQFMTKLQTAVTAGNGPDVFWMSPILFQQYASNGILKQQQGVDTSVFPQQLVKECQYNGQQYGMPKDFDTIGVWYNKKLFDAAGVAYPQAGWTWADFQAAADKLTNRAKGVYGTVAEMNGQQTYYNTIYQAGGQVITADGKSGYTDPKTIEGLKFWTDLVAKKDAPSVQQMSDTAPINMFETGKVAMYWAGSWNIPAFAQSSVKNDIDVAPLPVGEKAATIINGLCNVVYAKTKHPDEAQKFEAFLSSQQAQEIEGKSGAVIPAYNGTQSSWVAAYPNYHVQSYLDQVPDGVPMPASKNTIAWLLTEYQVLGKAWSGDESVNTAATKMAAAMNALLAKEKS